MGISALTPFEPAFISILGTLKPIGFSRTGDEDQVTTEVSLEGAAALMNASLLEQVDLAPSEMEDGTVEVIVSIEQARIAEIKMLGRDLSTGLERAGATLNGDMRAFFDAFQVTVAYPMLDGDTRVSPPPPDLAIELGEASCHAD